MKKQEVKELSVEGLTEKLIEYKKQHADLKMATTYVQDVSEQTDRVINNTRKLIIQDGS